MPLLALRCDSCGHVFEELARAEDVPLLACNKCGARVERHYQGKSLFALIGKNAGCGPAGDCARAGTGCGFACRH